ncbi:MAG: sulfatase-like hydrolase/transferase [Planctomycetaceae bacterium]|nr:sulfatase-like hydrolase/transferase [Planctomycetaceae bacterium]
MKFSSGNSLLRAACLLAVALLPTVTASARPNILLIYTDDHSYRTIGCYPQAYPWVETPNIDALATNGVRFEYAYIGTWCMPSRATLLTGHHQYGVRSMRMEGQYPGSTYDPQQCPFWPAVFREHGYLTCQIGKWHTGTDTGANRDWDHQIVWNRPRYPANSGKYFYDQLIETNGGPARLTRGYSTDNYTNWAEDFIRGEHRRDEDRPWYLWVCYGAVHGPFTPAERHRETYPNISVPVPQDIYPPRPGKPAYMQKIDGWVPDADGNPAMNGGFGGLTVEDTKSVYGNTLNGWVRQYHQGVKALDESVGRLVSALKESGQYDNTLIVFTSDQGFAWGQHGFHTKLAPYDANIRSPLIVSMPSQLPTGKVVQHPVAGVDLVPTFFHFAGIDLPWKMHGHDLTPLLKNPESDWPHPALTAFTARMYGDDTIQVPDDSALNNITGIPWYFMLRQGQYKYIRNLVEGETEELYDLTADPDELTNLAQQAEHRQRLLSLRAATVDELRRTDAGIVEHLPAVAGE